MRRAVSLQYRQSLEKRETPGNHSESQRNGTVQRVRTRCGWHRRVQKARRERRRGGLGVNLNGNRRQSRSCGWRNYQTNSAGRNNDGILQKLVWWRARRQMELQRNRRNSSSCKVGWTRREINGTPDGWQLWVELWSRGGAASSSTEDVRQRLV